jgi:hypothetical protein
LSRKIFCCTSAGSARSSAQLSSSSYG